MNKTPRIEIGICSDSDFENLVSEIRIDGRFIGLVTKEPNEELCFFLPERFQSEAKIELAVLNQAIKRAADMLLTNS